MFSSWVRLYQAVKTSYALITSLEYHTPLGTRRLSGKFIKLEIFINRGQDAAGQTTYLPHEIVLSSLSNTATVAEKNFT